MSKGVDRWNMEKQTIITNRGQTRSGRGFPHPIEPLKPALDKRFGVCQVIIIS